MTDAGGGFGGPAFRCGLVALAGRPNVGKSTLVNRLCGAHVSIVSDRPQTTRRRVAGIDNGDGWQIVLLDLPGFQRPRDGLTGRMQEAVDETLGDADAVLVVLDATEAVGAGDRRVAATATGAGKPIVVALNKVDRLEPPAVAVAIARVADLVAFEELHPVSARTGEGVDALEATLVRLLPPGPPLYAQDAATVDPLRLRIAELVREQALHRTREEVPHALAVVVEEVEPPRGRRVGVVRADVVVETPSQQRILIGAGGSMVRAIGTAARPPIEELLGGQVHLELRVRVRRGWRDDPRLLDELG